MMLEDWQIIDTDLVNNYRTKYVVFLDLLGFRELVKRSGGDVLERHRLVEALKLVRDTLCENPAIDFRFTHFSDCIILSAERSPQALWQIFQSVELLTCNLLQYDIFVRGGLAVGPTHHSKDFVFGTAVTEAYELECTSKAGPLVLLSSEVVEEVERLGPAFKQWLREKKSGKFFVHYRMVQYGQGAASLAKTLGVPQWWAQELLDLHRRVYDRYWQWSEWISQVATFGRTIETVFRWPIHVTPHTKANTISNFPMQSHGTEMLRWACTFATEQGIEVHAPVQDALLVGGENGEIEDVVAATRKAMEQASDLVLDGFVLRSDVNIVRYPDRYVDKRGVQMWNRVMGLLGSGGGMTQVTTLSNPPTTSWEPLLTPEEAATYLRIHPKTVIRMARNRTIPALRLGKHWRFRRSDLTAWAATQVESACQPDE
jgi:excisionase family DNA binding protein